MVSHSSKHGSKNELETLDQILDRVFARPTIVTLSFSFMWCLLHLLLLLLLLSRAASEAFSARSSLPAARELTGVSKVCCSLSIFFSSLELIIQDHGAVALGQHIGPVHLFAGSSWWMIDVPKKNLPCCSWPMIILLVRVIPTSPRPDSFLGFCSS